MTASNSSIAKSVYKVTSNTLLRTYTVIHSKRKPFPVFSQLVYFDFMSRMCPTLFTTTKITRRNYKLIDII